MKNILKFKYILFVSAAVLCAVVLLPAVGSCNKTPVETTATTDGTAAEPRETSESSASSEDYSEVENFDYDGGKYTGPWYRGIVPHGQGTIVWVDDGGGGYEIYTGNFVYGSRTGFGELEWSNGVKYSGRFYNGRMEGEGTLTWPDGSYLKGDWKDNKLVGEGMVWHIKDDGSFGSYKVTEKDGEYINVPEETTH